MLSQINVAVLYHIFYEDTITHIKEQLKYLTPLQPTFFFNICSDLPHHLETTEILRNSFPGSLITTTSNKGKDIGGKLFLLNACILAGINPDWIVFLHDKKSLQALNAKTWKNDLFKIIANEQLGVIVDTISNDPDIGIVAAENYVVTELTQNGQLTGNNGRIISGLMDQYKINCHHYEYVAGTMFWAKASPLLEFFRTYDPLEIRAALEPGNVIDNFSGTYTHSWERLLSWIIISKELTIKTI